VSEFLFYILFFCEEFKGDVFEVIKIGGDVSYYK